MRGSRWRTYLTVVFDSTNSTSSKIQSSPGGVCIALIALFTTKSMKELIRSTWEWHNDYENLCNALRAMKQIADHINESMHKFEKSNKVVKIQSDLGTLPFL